MAGGTVELGGLLSCTVVPSADGTRLVFRGEITEDSNLEPLLPRVSKAAIIDLAEVSRLTSCGIREWVGFVYACEDAGANVVLERCSPFVVSQLSAIANLAGRRGRVQSVLAPYVCTACRHEHLELLEVASARIAERMVCPKCKGTMELEDVPEVYEAVLEHAR
jgi:anti-anti-sigma regulatory factor